MLSSFT